MYVFIPAAARFCLNETIVVLAQLHTCRYASLNPLRQLIWTIFCGWSTAFPKRIPMSQDIQLQEAHLRVTNSILPLVFTPITPYPAITYDAILAHNDDQLPGCPETEGDTYLWCTVS